MKNVRVHDTILSAASIYDFLGNYLDIMNWFISGLASWTSTTRRADADARAQASPAAGRASVGRITRGLGRWCEHYWGT
jgi:hypothetical protein